MADSPFPSKPEAKISGSLALRTLLVAFSLLVVPLIIESLFIYQSDYRLKIQDLVLSLEATAHSRNRLTQTYLEGKREILTLVKPGDDLKVIAEKTGFVWIGTAIPPADPSLIYLQEGGWIGAISARDLLKTIQQKDRLPFAFNVSLLSADGTVVATTHSQFPPKGLIYISSDSKPALSRNRLRYIAVKSPLDSIPLTVVVDANEGTIGKFSLQGPLSHLLSLLVLIVVIGGTATWLLTRRITKPFKALCDVMQQVGQGQLDCRYVPDQMGFEINQLGALFNQMIESLLIHMEEAKQEKLGRELLANELRIGRDIQKAILPSHMPKLPGVDIATGFLSAQEVGGDFYDVLEQDGKLLFGIADTSGKGVSACLYSLCVRSMLRSFASENPLNTALQRTNSLFCLDTGESGTFVTGWIGVFDPTSRTLTYSSCGHFPALLRRTNGEILTLNTEGIALGVDSSASIHVKDLSLSPGDLLLLYTDGIIEAHHHTGELFGIERLKHLLQPKPASVLVQEILAEVAAFSAGMPQHDDITLLILRVT